MPYVHYTEDNVNIVTTDDSKNFKNTVFGELVLSNINNILQHFDISKDIEKTNNLSLSNGKTLIPLGVIR